MSFTGLLSLLLHFFVGGDSNFISDLETVKQVLDSKQVIKYSLKFTFTMGGTEDKDNNQSGALKFYKGFISVLLTRSNPGILTSDHA